MRRYRYKKCYHNHRLDCYVNRCPVQSAFFRRVEAWALTGRTPRSIDLSAVIGGLDIGASERRAVRQSTMYQLFNEGEHVLAFVEGHVKMTRAICRDLARARRKWREAKNSLT